MRSKNNSSLLVIGSIEHCWGLLADRWCEKPISYSYYLLRICSACSSHEQLEAGVILVNSLKWSESFGCARMYEGGGHYLRFAQYGCCDIRRLLTA